MKPTVEIETLNIKDCLNKLGIIEATANIFVLPKFKKTKSAQVNKP